MTQEKKKNVHEGHRSRLIDSYDKIDFNDLSPHQVLEYILFYVVNRKDVNEMAHRLLDKYGSVQNVLDANVQSLQEEKGISDRTAKMIVGFVKIFDYYMNSKMSRKTKISAWPDIYDICESLVRFHNQEVIYIVGLDAGFRVIGQRKLATGSSCTVNVRSDAVINFINETKAACVFFTHNHPGGSCKPSTTDIENNERIKNIVQVIGASFVDHVIVGSNGIYSIDFKKKVRSFIDNEDIKSLAQFYSDMDC